MNTLREGGGGFWGKIYTLKLAWRLMQSTSNDRLDDVLENCIWACWCGWRLGGFFGHGGSGSVSGWGLGLCDWFGVIWAGGDLDR